MVSLVLSFYLREIQFISDSARARLASKNAFEKLHLKSIKVDFTSTDIKSMCTKSLALILYLSSLNLWALTPLCGRINLPTSLIRSRSPYLITGDLYVPPNSRLTIESGVEVFIGSQETCHETKQQDYSDSTLISIKIDGAFYVEGSPEAPVFIGPQNNEPGKIQWDGIRIWNGNRLSTQIQYLYLRGANRGIHVMNSKFNVANSVFEDNGIGIHLMSNGNIAIFNSIFTKNQLAGIYQESSSPRIYANVFYQNYSQGIWSDSRSSLEIGFNAFFQNGENDCYRCPYKVASLVDTNWLGDSVDTYKNQFVDPYFIESSTTKKRELTDFDVATPLTEVLDTNLAKQITMARQRYENLGISWSKPFVPRGEKGSFRLSKYSTLRGAAPNDPFFANDDADSSRGDIGLYGGTPDRVKRIFPFD